MPKLSDTMTEGTLVKWKKKVGDQVKFGDVLAEVETDKATMEMEAFDDGKLAEIYVEEGGRVAIGAKLALLLGEGESEADLEQKDTASTDKRGEKKEDKAEKASDKKSSSGPAPATSQSGGDRVKASPLARKIAEERGVDLSSLTGSGPGGRIVREDVVNARPGNRSAGGGSAPAAVPVVAQEGEYERIPLSGMRKVIAERLLLSKTTIPHFYLNIEVDIAPLMELRAALNTSAEKDGSPKFTVNDLLLKAAVEAAVLVPKVNAAFDGDALVQFNTVHLSVAVAVDDGLVTPVIRSAEKLSLRKISDAMRDLATRARSKKLKPEEYQGGTITVSNLGSYGIESFSAIVNPPQAMILAIGTIVKKPVVNQKGEVVVGQRMGLGLSCDHRVVDGAIGAEYMSALRKLVESPALMLV